MKLNINFKKIFSIKIIACILILILLVLGIYFGVKYIQNKKNNYEQLISDIEYVYYYSKLEPGNINMFSTLNKGDGVSRSVWENYLSTSDTQVKKLYELIKADKEKFSNYKESILLDDLKKSVDIFNNIKLENKNRIENITKFSKNNLEKYKKDLLELLNKIKETSRNYKSIDLR
jgi:hypothetical protein